MPLVLLSWRFGYAHQTVLLAHDMLRIGVIGERDIRSSIFQIVPH